MKKLLWIQKRNESECSWVIADGVTYKETDDEYGDLYRYFGKIYRVLPWHYVCDGIKVAVGCKGVFVSGHFEQQEDCGRRMVFSYFQRGTAHAAENLVVYAAPFSLPAEDTKVIAEQIAKGVKVNKNILYAIFAMIFAGIVCLIYHLK